MRFNIYLTWLVLWGILSFNGFFHPPCVPVSFLGEALYPFPVGLVLLLPSMFSHCWAFGSLQPDISLVFSNPFRYRLGGFTDIGSVTSLARDVIHYAVTSVFRNWILGAYRSCLRSVESERKTVRTPWLSRPRLSCWETPSMKGKTVKVL